MPDLTIKLLILPGGHINNFVTLSALLTRNIKWHLALLYMIAQTAGAIVGAAWLYALIPSYQRIDPGCFLPVGVTRGTVFAWEVSCLMLIKIIYMIC